MGAESGTATVAVEATAAAAEDVASHVEEAWRGGARRVVVDVSALPLMDSTVLGALVLAHRRLLADGAELVVAGATGDVRRAFEITGLERALQLDE